jgi:hypothetical protein
MTSNPVLGPVLNCFGIIQHDERPWRGQVGIGMSAWPVF